MPGLPLFFHISPDQCGETEPAALFEANGLRAVCDSKGRHTEDLVWAEAKNEQPFADRPMAKLFAGLYRNVAWRPPPEGWRRFKFIDRVFPGSYFILTTRSLDGRISDRLLADERAVAQCYMKHFSVTEDQRAEQWERDWVAHLDAVHKYFGDGPRLMRVDTESEIPLDLLRRLTSILGLDMISGPDKWSADADGLHESKLLQFLECVDLLEKPDWARQHLMNAKRCRNRRRLRFRTWQIPIFIGKLWNVFSTSLSQATAGVTHDYQSATYYR